MPNRSRLTLKLQHGANLSPEAIKRLDHIGRTAEVIRLGKDLILEGDNPEFVHFMKRGTACRYKVLPNGRRSIMALLLPGDFCDLHIAMLGRMDHSIGALTECEVSRIATRELEQMLAEHPSIGRACLWATLVDEAILREWLVNVGQRPSEQQLAHLFCELYMRLDSVGLTKENTFRMPFTQGTLGDLLGITSVHIQRTMARLREAGLIVWQDRNIRIPDFKTLAEFGEFDPIYLHLQTYKEERE